MARRVRYVYVAHPQVAKFSPVMDNREQKCIEKAAEKYDLEYSATNIDRWDDIRPDSRFSYGKMFTTKQWFDRVGLHRFER